MTDEAESAARDLLKALWADCPPDHEIFKQRIIYTQAHRLREVLGLSVDDLRSTP